MKIYIIWLIFLRLCGSENLDYSDYHPRSVPLQTGISLQAENPSPEYVAVMNNLCNNWQSPISYLQKRGYMSVNGEEPRYKEIQRPKHNTETNVKSKNYFFFPQNIKERSYRNNLESLEEEDLSESKGSDTESPATEIPTVPPRNETDGIMKKVKNKFLSIFSHRSNEDNNEESNENLQIDDNYFDSQEFIDIPDEYETSNKRIFERSVPKKPSKEPTSEKSINESDDLFSNLTDIDVQFIKSFINCFKNSKQNFEVQSLTETLNLNKTTTSKSSVDTTTETSKLNTAKPDATNSTTGSPIEHGKVTSTGSPIASGSERNTTSNPIKPASEGKTTTSSSKAILIVPECITLPPTNSLDTTTTENTNVEKDVLKTSTANSHDSLGEFTVDLDINQKNGTGEELKPMGKSAHASNDSTQLQSDTSNNNKYVTKSKFLAHLHHMVDEVGKPPHKRLDLAMVQEVIDKSKYFPLVTMGDTKTTECAPLRLNDMSFDLEWNKIEKSPEKGKEKLDVPSADQISGQSLAAKFLQDVNSYPNNNDLGINTLYADNFLDSQKALPDGLGLPLKVSTKREAFVSDSANHGNKISKLLSQISSDSDSIWEDDDYEPDSRRRTKDKSKIRKRKKSKSKSKGDASKQEPSIYTDLNLNSLNNDISKNANQFNSFDELKDIQFRVNDDDEEAISRFIANLNSPPEVFSFDVDKYLRSAQMEMKPQAPEFEYQSTEARTFYEFLDAPPIEKERFPVIEAPPQIEEETELEKLDQKLGVKRDLLRQYIKGVSSDLNHIHPDLYIDSQKTGEDKQQRSPNLDTDIPFRTNSLIEGFSTNLDAMNYIKSNEPDDFVDNFYLLNDGSSQIYDMSKKDTEIIQSDQYSPQSLEIDLDLDKKFKDLNIGALNEADSAQQDSESLEAKSNVDEYESAINQQNEGDKDFEVSNEQYK